MRILVLGEIVGKPGVYTMKNGLKKLKQQYAADFVIANGEGATGGFGIGKNHSIYLRKMGVDVITTGEKTYYKKDMVDQIARAPYILRPANYPPMNPGKGWRIYDIGKEKLAVLNLLGQSEFSRVHLSNPFSYLDMVIEKIRSITGDIIVQFHAATTAEKQSMFFHADGKVSAVIGTHCKAMTSDERIFPKGTAVLTDNGRCGSIMSVGGLAPEVEIRKFLTQIPERSADCWDGLEIQGAVITLKDDGSASEIETFRYPVKTPEQEVKR